MIKKQFGFLSKEPENSELAYIRPNYSDSFALYPSSMGKNTLMVFTARYKPGDVRVKLLFMQAAEWWNYSGYVKCHFGR